jgi:hypothetical protein
MTTYARIVDGVVAEFLTPPEGFALQDVVHPNLLPDFVPMSDTAVAVGWHYDGTTFSPPPAPEPSPQAGQVSRASFRLWAWRNRGAAPDDLRDVLRTMPDQAAGEALIAFEEPVYARDASFVQHLISHLAMDADEVNAAFTEAK